MERSSVLVSSSHLESILLTKARCSSINSTSLILSQRLFDDCRRSVVTFSTFFTNFTMIYCISPRENVIFPFSTLPDSTSLLSFAIYRLNYSAVRGYLMFWWTFFSILRALQAYFNVLIVSSMAIREGDTHAIMEVRVFPPNESFNNLVSFESL